MECVRLDAFPLFAFACAESEEEGERKQKKKTFLMAFSAEQLHFPSKYLKCLFKTFFSLFSFSFIGVERSSGKSNYVAKNCHSIVKVKSGKQSISSLMSFALRYHENFVRTRNQTTSRDENFISKNIIFEKKNRK
jgi:hypothetical protein